MTLYNVHIYREMRVFFPGIEADSAEDAAGIAADRPTPDADYTEDCDGENLAALVDVVGDEGFEQSVTIDFDAERQRKALPQLLMALRNAQRLILDMGRIIRSLDDQHEWPEFWTQDGYCFCSDSRFDAIQSAIDQAAAIYQQAGTRRIS